MKANNYTVIRYDADEGKVFDWANLEEHVVIEEVDGKEVERQEHLYAKTLWIGHLDSIDNYVEVDKID